MNDLYYYKYIKYKKKYTLLKKKALCTNMETYATTMSEHININGKIINLKFHYLDNWNECYQEAVNFINNKDYNLQYLHDSIENLNNGKVCNIKPITYIKKLELTQIIIISIGSSSTQSYYFRETRNGYTPVVIDLNIGKWYGVQNYEDKNEHIAQLCKNVIDVANRKNIKHVILHKSGSFGFKHIREPRIIVPIDTKIPECLEYNSLELEDKKIKDAYTTLNKLMEVIMQQKSDIKWFSVGNFDCFKADWVENVGSLYFKKTFSEKPLYIMDFGGGSNSLKEITNNNGLVIRNLFSGRYNQSSAISLINNDEKIDNVIANYKNEGQDKTIKQQMIDTVSINMTENKTSIYIFQTGLQREFGNDFCSKNIRVTNFFTKEGEDIWSNLIKK